ncbi:MAG: hypothetical protein ACLR56_11910 [Oscillospiraceae bacterium]
MPRSARSELQLPQKQIPLFKRLPVVSPVAMSITLLVISASATKLSADSAEITDTAAVSGM